MVVKKAQKVKIGRKYQKYMDNSFNKTLSKNALQNV